MFTKQEIKFLRHLPTNNWETSLSADESKLIVEFSPLFGEHDGSFEISVSDFEDLVSQLEFIYQEYDPDFETYIWLGSDGHGHSGAPYRMRDILDEMENYERELENLSLMVSRFQEQDQRN